MTIVPRRVWRKLMRFARDFDVEAGESPEYQYSVRESTGIVTVWTQRGWRDGWYVCRYVPTDWTNNRIKRLHVECEEGQPPDRSWPKERAEHSLRELLSYTERLPDEDLA